MNKSICICCDDIEELKDRINESDIIYGLRARIVMISPGIDITYGMHTLNYCPACGKKVKGE